MAFSADYQRLVLDDLASYKDIAQPLRSSILARLCIHSLPLKALHPNPADEFCDPKIGPNEGIISDYIRDFGLNIKHNDPPVSEALIVEKMSTGGYMLLNGHHRWMAAAKMKLPRVPVLVVNTTSREEIMKKLSGSTHHQCVSFDLDEVLLTDRRSKLADHALPFPYNFILKRTLRRHACLLISQLQRLGFDVWVYSGSGISAEEINRLMKLHKAHVDGVVNFIKNKKSSAALKQAFRNQYRLSVHIDNESVLWVDTATRAYDSIPILGGVSWADDAFAKVRGLAALNEPEGMQEHA